MDSKDIIPLSVRHRTAMFYILLGIFIVIVPLLGFYANGYRYNFSTDTPAVTVTGGLYIATASEESEIYLNDEIVDNARFFRQATYIQGVDEGIHQVHVQGEGLHTWVKRLPVYRQLVTEASAFTVPVVPQVRPITPFYTEARQPVYIATSSSTAPFSFASSSVPVLFSTSTATTTYIRNQEYDLLEDTFSQEIRTQNRSTSDLFRFASEQNNVETEESLATTTVERNDIALTEKHGNIYAEYRGSIDDIPYYFCVPNDEFASTSARYGEHVAQAVSDIRQSTTSVTYERGVRFEQICRTEIQIDARGVETQSFAFVPNASDLVLLHQTDGIYVTEIDDRSWQNHQQLYPRGDIEMLVEDGQIFIKDGDYFAELYIQLQ